MPSSICCFFNNKHCHDSILLAKTASVSLRLYYVGGSHFINSLTLPMLLDQNNLPPGRYLPDVTLQQSSCLPAAEITSSELICPHRDSAASSYRCPKCHLLGGTTGSLCLLEKFWLVSENVSDAWPRALGWLSMFPEALCLWGIKDIEVLIKQVVPKKRFKVKKKKVTLPAEVPALSLSSHFNPHSTVNRLSQ